MKLTLVLISLLILGSAGVALSLRNLIHSALLLVGAWFGIAAYYLWADAEFIAFAQVLVYGGAVSMVVLFAVLLTRHAPTDGAQSRETPVRTISALVVALAVFLLLARGNFFLAGGAPGLSSAALAKEGTARSTVKEIGLQLMGPDAAALLVAGLLLTVALIGAVVLAARPAANREKEDA